MELYLDPLLKWVWLCTKHHRLVWKLQTSIVGCGYITSITGRWGYNHKPPVLDVVIAHASHGRCNYFLMQPLMGVAMSHVANGGCGLSLKQPVVGVAMASSIQCLVWLCRGVYHIYHRNLNTYL